MKNHLLTVAVVVLFFSSCTTTKFLTSNVKPAEVNDIQQFETLSYISLIESGNKGKLNDTLSEKSKLAFQNILNEFKEIPLTGRIELSDSNSQKRIEKETEYLCATADAKRSIGAIKITPVLDSLLETSGKRFGLLTVTTGFTRKKGNYSGQIAKGIATGILTLGMYYQTPIKSNSTIYMMIIDARDNNIAFFKKLSWQEKDPMERETIRKQIKSIFEGYFWKTE